MTQNEAKIFLSAQRGKTEFSWFRSFHSFDFGNFQDPNKEPIGKLRVFNDNTLAAGSGMKMQVEKPTEVLILPLVGGIEFKNSSGYHDFLEAGKVQVFSAETGMEYEVLNPYENELINYLEIWIEKKMLSVHLRFRLILTSKNAMNSYRFLHRYSKILLAILVDMMGEKKAFTK